MMQKHFYKMIFLTLTTVLLLSACGPSEAELKATAAAQTLEVIAIKETTMFDTLLKLTQTEAAKPPTETPTPTSTQTPLPSPTLAGLATPTNPLPGGGTGSGDQAGYVSDTIPDNTRKTPGESFTMTWKLSNTGSTTWSTNYALAFVTGNQMNAKSENYLPVQVAPGSIVDISVPMTAPAASGTYRGDWRLKNANGQSFGPTIWVQIVVGPPLADTTTPTVTGTISTSTPTSTPTVDPNFKVTAVSMDDPYPNQTLTCGQNFFLTAGGTITAGPAGVVKYIWSFDGIDNAEQSITFSGASTLSVNPGTSGNLTAVSGKGYVVKLRTTSPLPSMEVSKTYIVVCN